MYKQKNIGLFESYLAISVVLTIIYGVTKNFIK